MPSDLKVAFNQEFSFALPGCSEQCLGIGSSVPMMTKV